MENKIKISVIIPVYGIENYIEECLTSVINQTLKEIEIIIVNDGTKDNSMKIVQKYLKDKRIKIINKANGGLSSARNFGLKVAKGEYIYNLDGDDFITETFLDKMYTYAKKYDLDIVICDINIFCDTQKKIIKIWRDTDFITNKIYSGVEYLKEYFLGNGCPAVWNKLFKKELYIKNNIFHPENISYGEDGATMSRLMVVANTIGKVNEELYYYRQRITSMTKAEYVNLKDYFISYNITVNYLKKNKVYQKLEKYLPTYKFYYIYSYLILKEYSEKLPKDYQKTYKLFFKEIKKMKIYNLTLKRKILIISFRINKKIGNLLIKLNNKLKDINLIINKFMKEKK